MSWPQRAPPAHRMLRLKRVYDPPTPEDGERILVERLWPRGLSREAARLSAWFREVAPSPELRRWFGHRPERWEGFRLRYRQELEAPSRRRLVEELARHARRGTVTLVFAARDEEHNGAVVLKEVVEELLRAGVPPG